MQLLGTYNNELASFQYQQLLALLQAAIASGDLSSGSSFDKTTLLQLENQAVSFDELPSATAGTRALDESLNQPISLLQARFTALLAETNSFVSRSAALLQFLQDETDMLDQILAADKLASWVATLPAFVADWSTSWDFSTGEGKQSLSLPKVDPTNSVLYPGLLTSGRVFDTSTGLFSAGLMPPKTRSSISPKNMNWTFETTGESDPLYGPDLSWTELTLLEKLPRVDFSATPAVSMILPLTGGSLSFITVTGNVPTGALPTYLRLLFYPRWNSVTATPANGTLVLSPYTIDPDSVQVYVQDPVSGAISTFYTEGVDYTVDQTGFLNILTITEQITVRFSENFPAYQCSVDQQTWSDIHMLDVNRPFRDDETEFYPLAIKNGAFPLTDESGVPSGLYFTLNTTLRTDYTLLITTPSSSVYGPVCTLEVDLDQVRYCSGIHLKPFSAFPAKLQTIQVKGIAETNLTTVYNGSVLLDSATDILFPRQLVSSVILTFVQENYTITEYSDLDLDYLRRSTLASVEASLPFSLGEYVPPTLDTARGYQYSLGFESIAGIDTTPQLPGVFVQGPWLVDGCPLLTRLDAQYTGSCNFYLCYQAYSSSGALLDSNTSGVLLTPGAALVIPYVTGLNQSTITSTKLYVKCVLRSATSVVSRFSLQAALR